MTASGGGPRGLALTLRPGSPGGYRSRHRGNTGEERVGVKGPGSGCWKTELASARAEDQDLFQVLEQSPDQWDMDLLTETR